MRVLFTADKKQLGSSKTEMFQIVTFGISNSKGCEILVSIYRRDFTKY